jgi:putative nucleotidyltransferase with HDIG domain
MISSGLDIEIKNFSQGKPIERQYFQFSELDCPNLENYLASLLRSISLEYLLEIVFTVLNELLVNAFKANVKRVYFEKIGKNICNKEEYLEGIANFREEFGDLNSGLVDAVENSNYRIQLKLLNEKDKIRFWVSNNASMVEEEMERINTRLISASKVKNLTEAYQDNLDSYESSGLGLVLVQLLLRNSGITENFFSIRSENDITTAYFEIPKEIIPLEMKEKIRNILLDGVEGLPPFPKNISKLLSIVNNKNSTIQKISTEIEKDPGITVEVIKLSNSPLFQVQGQIASVSEAIKRIGLRNIEKILYAAGARSVFPLNNSRVKEIWKHASLTAFMSIHLSQLRKPHARKELCSIGGLLHDLGRMVLVTLDRYLIEVINNLREDRLMNHSSFIEEITLGANHTDIGLILATKWNFPEELKEIITHHHRPWQSKQSFLAESETVYIADIMANLQRKRTNFAILDPNILEKFSIKSYEQLVEMADDLSLKYSKLLTEEAKEELH